MTDVTYPIRPMALLAENFRGLSGEHTLNLERDLTVLIGSNGAGKSSLLIAMEWCLFGAEATTKSGSEIEERGNWTLANADAEGEIRVVLELKVKEGRARLTRRRPADTSARDEDDVLLELPDQGVLRGEEVRDWLAWNQLPDWKSWKRSFCQHQELSRARVTDDSSRSAAIAGMLGLDDYRKVSDNLKKVKVKRLEQRAAEELEELAKEQQRSLERPGLEIHDLERQLERYHIAAAQAGSNELNRRVTEYLNNASAIATELGIAASGIPEADAPVTDVLAWAPSWRSQVNEKLEALSKERDGLSSRVETLRSSIEALKPARLAETDAKNVLVRSVTELGSVEVLLAQRDELAKQRGALEEEGRRQDALGKLLRDALQIVKETPSPCPCPVCGEDRTALDQVIQEKLAAHAPDALRSQLEEIAARDSRLQEHIERLKTAENAHATAKAQIHNLEEKLRGQLPADVTESALNAELLKSWDEEARRLRDRGDVGEHYLTQQREKLDILELLVKLGDANARANATAGELTQTREFEELQRVIDDAAGLASDLEALGAMARKLEDERSKERIAAVNESIDTYFATITGGSERGRVRVQPKRTATKITYQLVDDQGRAVTGLLNQAAFNALSLAALFASGESRARLGLPQFLILDDPGQSLDQEHEAGLARAIANFASIAPVLVATYPGVLANELSRLDTENSRVCHLSRTPNGAQTTIQEA